MTLREEMAMVSAGGFAALVLLYNRVLAPVVGSRQRGFTGAGRRMGTGVCPAGLSAGQQLSDHLLACTGGVSRLGGLLHYGHIRGRGPDLAHEAGVRCDDRRSAHWGCPDVSFFSNRFYLGQTHVGHLVGVGRTHNVHADSAVPVSRYYGAAKRVSKPRRR